MEVLHFIFKPIKIVFLAIIVRKIKYDKITKWQKGGFLKRKNIKFEK